MAGLRASTVCRVAAGGRGRRALFRAHPTQGFGVAAGTFVNQAHHSATMLGMMLPVFAGLIAYDMRRHRHGAPHADSAPRRVLVFASSVLVLVCLVFTHSRAGVASALAGLALSSVLLVGHKGERISIVVGAVIVGGLVLASLIGLAPLLERFEPATLRMTGAHRAALYAATVRAAVEFLPFGSGLSTFAGVFPRFQGKVFGGYIDYAHNDYLQLFLEIGLAGIVVLLLFAVRLCVRMADLVRRRRGRSFTLLQLAAGIALVPALLHGMFDFAAHAGDRDVVRDPGRRHASSGHAGHRRNIVIDLHCHLLPGIDDGPRDVATALEMARIAVADGIHTVACTPHIYPGLFDNDSERIAAQVADLRRRLAEENIGVRSSPAPTRI